MSKSSAETTRDSVQKYKNAGLIQAKVWVHPEEAWKFITWLIQPEIQEWWSMESNYLPIRRSVLKSPTYQEFLAGQEFFGIDYAEASRHFERAREIDPAFVQPLLYLATAYGNQRQYDRAVSAIDRLQQRRDELTPFERCLVDWYAADLPGHLEEALKHARQALQLAPTSGTVNYIGAIEALHLNRPQEVVARRETLERNEPFLRRTAGSWRTFCASRSSIGCAPGTFFS